MPIFYEIQERKIPFSKGEKSRYYVIAKSWDTVEYDDLIEYMVHHTSLTKPEAMSALDYLLEAIPQLLKLGKTVKLGALGYLRATIRSDGSDTKEEAGCNKVTDVRLRFVPGLDLRRQIRAIPLEKFPEKGLGSRSCRYNRAMKKAQQETERRQVLETVRRCKSEGLPVDLIARITGFAEEEVERLMLDAGDSSNG